MSYIMSEPVMCNLLIYGGREFDIEDIEDILNRFNLLAFVLHSPAAHLDFDVKLTELSSRLWHITGQNFLFFTGIETSDEELRHFKQRNFYQRLQAWETEQLSKKGLLTKPQLTIDEAARKLRIPYNSLPCIVVFNNIKAKMCRWYTTSPDKIEDQLYQLGRIASERPTIKNDWEFASKVLEKNKHLINLCENSGADFLSEKEMPFVEYTRQRETDAQQTKTAELSLAEIVAEDIPSLKDKENVLKLVGSNWFVKFNNKSTTISDKKKFRYVIYLLENPGQYLNNTQLVSAIQGHAYKEFKEESSDMEENLTKAQKIKIEQAANALLAELEQAKNINDESQIKNIKQELDAIEKSLREVYDATLTILEKNKAIIKVRENVFRKNVKNARVNVRNNLSNAYRDIGKDLPELERHLRQCIDTKATYAVYDPEKAKTDKSISWHIFW